MLKLLTATVFAAALASASAAIAQVGAKVPGGPDHPAPSTYSCSEELGHLRRVHVGELAAVQDPTRVWVTPICVGDRMFRSDGNAGALRSAIAANDAMAAALEAGAFTPDDVVGVRMIGEDTVTLYVHPLDR
jgi:hypothetical protein